MISVIVPLMPIVPYTEQINECLELLTKQTAKTEIFVVEQPGERYINKNRLLNQGFRKSKCFDLVYNQGLMEHFRDPLPAGQEQARVLKKGGCLVINVPQRYTGYTLMKRQMMRKGKWKLGWETEFSYRDLKRLGHLLNLNERRTFGFQYCKSWREPVFVLRDLYDKLHRRNPLKDKPLFISLRSGYEYFWKRIETHWGHFFLQNIVMVLEKPLG